MTIDATAGAITWSPTGADLGIHQVTVVAGASIHEVWLSNTPIGLDLTDARLVEHLERSLVDGETTHRCGTVSRPCHVARFADPATDAFATLSMLIPAIHEFDKAPAARRGRRGTVGSVLGLAALPFLAQARGAQRRCELARVGRKQHIRRGKLRRAIDA